MPAGKLLQEESNITAGDLNVNNAYDLKLMRLASGNYQVLVFMKIQFFFNNTSGNSWTSFQKTMFVKNWEADIKKSWGGRTLKVLSSGKKVILNFEFKIQEAGWMFDHWEITVDKIKAGSFSTSYVTPTFGAVKLDSEDLTSVSKAPGYKQRGAVHEFGHMPGLLDEYKNSVHTPDTGSIMHSSELIRPRHNSTVVKWMNAALIANKIQ